MTLTINDTTMTSDHSTRIARRSPGRNGREVSQPPGRDGAGKAPAMPADPGAAG